MYKSALKSRTVWLAVAQAIAGIVVAMIAADPAIEKIGFIVVLKSVLDFFLRLDTKKELV